MSCVSLSPAENGDLSRDLSEAQSKLNQITRLRSTLVTQVDELKRQLEEESKVKKQKNNIVHIS